MHSAPRIKSRSIILILAAVALSFAGVAGHAAETSVITPPPAPVTPAAPAPATPPKPAEAAPEVVPTKKKEDEETPAPAAESNSAAPKKPSIWQRATAAMQSGGQHAAVLLQRDTEIATLRQQLAAATQRATSLDAELADHRAGQLALENALNALQITPETRAMAAAGDENAAREAVTQHAQRAAVAIAAGQGARPVPALPEADDKNAAQAAFTAAAAEQDPTKRALMFADAEQLLAEQGKK